MSDGEDSLVSWPQLTKLANKESGALLFMAFWLSFWSLGVAFIQGITLNSLAKGAGFGPTALFVLTHGGTEVGVLYAVTRTLIKESQKPRHMTSQKTLEEQMWTWQLGHSSYLNAIVSVGLACIVYILLFSPILVTLSGVGFEWMPFFEETTDADSAGTSPMAIAICLLFAVVWMTTWIWWVKAYRAQIHGLTTATIRLTAHRILIYEARPGFDQTYRFQTQAAQIELGAGVIRITQEDTVWERKYAKDQTQKLQPLVDVIQQAKVDGADTMEIPKELDALRGQEPKA